MKLKTMGIIALGACLFFTSPIRAGASLDLKVGGNLSHQWGNDVIDGALLKIGVIAGMGMGVKLTKYFTVQPEIVISTKGIESQDGNTRTVLKLNYFEIPVLAKLCIPAGMVLPVFYAGPCLDLLVSAKSVATRNGVENEEDIKEDMKLLDVGAVVGGGIDIKAGPGRLTLELRYTLGFLTTYEPIEELGEEITKDRKNGALSLIIGYGLDFGGE